MAYGERAFRLVAVASAVACLPMAWLALGEATPTAIAIALCAAFTPYALLLVTQPPERSRLWLACVLPGVLLALAPSALSDDVHRYAWDARVLVDGRMDPYAHAPDARALVGLRDAGHGRVNHRHIPTIYPPLAQALFALARVVWAGPTGLKLFALAFHLLAALLVGRLARRLGTVRQATRAQHLYALNPLALSEAALGGHVDAAVGATACGLGLALVANRRWVAAWLVGALAGLKLVGLALWPLLFPRGAAVALLALCLGLLALYPTARAGYGDAGASVSGLGHYTQRWRGKEAGFRALEAAGEGLVNALAQQPVPEGLGPTEVRLGALAPLLDGLASRLQPTRSLLAEKKAPRGAGVFDRAFLAALIGKLLALLLVLALALGMARRGTPPVTALRVLLWAVLLTAPQVHPWYLLWLLPLELAAGGAAGVAWSAVAAVAYAPLAGWQSQRFWHEHPFALGGQYTLVAAALGLALAAAHRNHNDRHVGQR